MKKSLFLSLVLLLGLSLTACGDKKVASKKHDTLRMVTSAVRTLDSVKATDTASFNILGNTQETLLVYKNNAPVLGAAKSYTISEDGKTYTFTLRDSIKWSDGKPMTSKDFKYAWMRLIDPNVGASYAFFLFSVKNAKEYYLGKNGVLAKDVGLYTPDDKTLVVKLNTPVPFFTQLVAFPGLSPQRADLFEKYKETYGSKASRLAFSGPYMVKNWVKANRVELVKNPNYWDAKNVKVEKIQFLVVKEPSTQFQMFERGQLDALEGTGGEFIARLKQGAAKKKWEEISIVSPRADFISFNFKTKKALLSKKVRMAFSLATDRKTFTEKILKANVPAYALVSPGISVGDIDYRKAVKQQLLDYGKDINPKALLIEGLKEEGLDANPANHSFGLLLKKNTTEARTQGEYLKALWEKRLGVKINLLASADFSDYLQKKANGQFDLLFQGWGADYNSPLSFLDLFTTTNGINSGKYSNPEVDALVQKLTFVREPQKRLEIFKEIENIYIIKDPVLAPLFYKNINFFKRSYVKGLELNLFGAPYELRWLRLD